MKVIVISVLASTLVSFLVSFAMMKFHINQLTKQMERFFEEEKKRFEAIYENIKRIIKEDVIDFIQRRYQ